MMTYRATLTRDPGPWSLTLTQNKLFLVSFEVSAMFYTGGSETWKYSDAYVNLTMI